MSEQNNLPTLSQYYKRFCLRLWREIKSHWGQAMIAIIAIIVVAFLQFYFGWIRRDETILSALLNISPSIGIALAYTLWLLIKTPWLLDVDRHMELGNAGIELKALSGKLEEFNSEATRPKFIFDPSLRPLDEFDEDNRYILSLDLENNGSRPALDIFTQGILVEDAPTAALKVIDTSVASEVEINEPLHLQTLLTLTSSEEPPLFIACALKYKDAITGKPYTQVFYAKWGGVKRGAIQKIHHLTIPERERVALRVKDQLAEFMADDSQNVGSIPNSKID